MKHCFIINPASGKSETKEGLDGRISAACEAAGIEYDVIFTKAVGDATAIIKSYCEQNGGDVRFYACGGDGTLCEVVGGVMALEESERDRVSIGVIPVGTGNDFVKNFAPRELFFDIGAQLEASEIEIDLVKCNEYYSINMINAGFDSEVVVKTADLKKKRFIPSKLAYICGLALTLIKKPGVRMDVSVDGGEHVHKSLLLTTFACGGYCGGGFFSNPDARLTDGMIDSLFIKNMSRTRFVSMVGDYKKGTHLTPKFEKIIEHIKAREYDIVFSKPTNVSIDGEIVKLETAHICVLPAAIRFAVPRGAVCSTELLEAETV